MDVSVPHQIYWQIPNMVLCVKLADLILIDDFVTINQSLNDHLNHVRNPNGVLIKFDATLLSRLPPELSRMKSSQTYADRHDVRRILVVSESKSVRLIMLLTFRFSRVGLHFVDNESQAEHFIRNMGITIG